jgi:hypothetical protein
VLACDPLTYISVDAPAWARVRIAAARYVTIDADAGWATSRGFAFAWAYDPRAGVLTIRVDDRPPSVPCESIATVIGGALSR